MIRKWLATAIILCMLASLPVYAATKPAGQQAAAGAESVDSSKAKLPVPSYCYVSQGMLFWGRPEGVAGIYIEFLEPDDEKSSSRVTADQLADAGDADSAGVPDETQTAEYIAQKKKNRKYNVVKSADGVVDIADHIKDELRPAFRVRSVPLFEQITRLDPSDWVYWNEFPEQSLTGLPLDGWVYVSGKWFCYQNGVKQYGWFKDGNKTFYLKPETGEMVTGWVYDERKWYYLSEETGVLLRKTFTPDGCYVDENGVWTGKTR